MAPPRLATAGNGFAIGLCALLAACSGDNPPAVSQDNAATTRAVQAALSPFEDYVRQNMTAWNVQGVAVGIVVGDRLVYTKGFGYRQLDPPAPVDENSVFEIGSVTKMFAGATLAMAVDDGLFAWDDRVTALDPTFRLKNSTDSAQVKVRDLLAQHLGLPGYTLTTLFILQYPADAIIQGLAYQDKEAGAIFGRTFAYQNVPHLEAGKLVANRSGSASWDAFLRSRIFTPLGMTHSHSTAAGFATEPNRVTGYVIANEAACLAVNGAVPCVNVARPLSVIPPFGPAGGIQSNVTDLAEWLKFQIGRGQTGNRRLISESNMGVLREAATCTLTRPPDNQNLCPPGSSYAQGLVLQQFQPETLQWHSGGVLGGSTFLGWMPNKQLGFVLLSNRNGGNFPTAVGFRFFDMVFGNPPVDYAAQYLNSRRAELSADTGAIARPASPAASASLPNFVGRYANDSYGSLDVSLTGGQLAISLVTPSIAGTLAHWDANWYRIDWQTTFMRELTDLTLLPPVVLLKFGQAALDGSFDCVNLTLDQPEIVFTRQSISRNCPADPTARVSTDPQVVDQQELSDPPAPSP